MTPLDFLNRLWQYKPEEQFLLIWTWPDRLSRWFTKLPEAAEYVTSINGGRDVYMGVGLAGKQQVESGTRKIGANQLGVLDLARESQGRGVTMHYCNSNAGPVRVANAANR